MALDPDSHEKRSGKTSPKDERGYHSKRDSENTEAEGTVYTKALGWREHGAFENRKANMSEIMRVMGKDRSVIE